MLDDHLLQAEHALVAAALLTHLVEELNYEYLPPAHEKCQWKMHCL